MAMFLTKDEVKELTHKITYSAQRRALNSMGIEHKMRPDGSVAILRAHAEKEFGAAREGFTSYLTKKIEKRRLEPNFDSVN